MRRFNQKNKLKLMRLLINNSKLIKKHVQINAQYNYENYIYNNISF